MVASVFSSTMLKGCFGCRPCENARDWRPDCVRSDIGKDLADRRGKISRIELRKHLMAFEVICTGLIWPYQDAPQARMAPINSPKGRRRLTAFLATAKIIICRTLATHKGQASRAPPVS